MHLIVLLIVGSVLAYDASGGGPSIGRIVGPLPISFVASLTIAPMIIATLVLAWVTSRCARGIDRTGRAAYVRVAQRALRAHRWAVTLVHLGSVFALGWPLSVRLAGAGNVVLLDEIFIIAPAIVFVTLGWAVHEPIERRLRDAEIFRSLDEGRPIHAPDRRWEYVSNQLRHHVLIVLVPLLLIIAWHEIVDRAVALADTGGLWGVWLSEPALTVVTLAGVLAVFLAMPALLRRIWRTSPLADGPLRDRLQSMCDASGVRCRDLLVWITKGMMYNGAVVGLFGMTRYILLTDGLLQEMEEKEVEAVMAHEIGHVVYRHIPWLIVGLISSVTVAGGVLAFAADSILVTASNTPLGTDSGLLEMLVVAISLAFGLWVFGHISRRFERQADAFAVSALAREHAAESGHGATSIDPESAGVMIDALGRVARLNHIPPSARMWRHGSILSRQKSLQRLPGQTIGKTTVDRQAARAKRAVVLFALVAAALIAMGV